MYKTVKGDWKQLAQITCKLGRMLKVEAWSRATNTFDITNLHVSF